MKNLGENDNILYLGIDLGNSQIKAVTNNNKVLLKSLYQTNFDTVNQQKGREEVRYNGITYTVGAGNTNTNKAKYTNEIYKLMLLTGIAKTFPKLDTITVNLVAGLPIADFKNTKAKNNLCNVLDSLKSCEITFNGVNKNITINKYDIWLEGGILLNELENAENRRFIIVDIGGKTVDTLEYYNNSFKENETFQDGIIFLKNKIIETFKKEENIFLDEVTAEDFTSAIFRNKNDFLINNKLIDLDKYKKIAESHLSLIFNKLDNKYNTESAELIFIGGGSLALKLFLESYKDFYNLIVMPNAEFLNAETYYHIAKRSLKNEQ